MEHTKARSKETA